MASRCSRCGRQNDDGARVCAHCGVDLDSSTQSLDLDAIAAGADLEADLERFPNTVGLLVVTRGPKGGSRYALDAAVITAGRDAKSDIFLDDVTVSRRHAEIQRRGNQYTVKDLRSLNGTYVNKQRVDEAVLLDGDEVQIGMFKLVFFHGTGS